MPMATPEAQREYMRAWMARRRNEWMKEHGPCIECGSWENLEVDHIDPDTKALEIRSLWSMSLSNPKRVAELAKCQVLCHNCHRVKTNKENSNRFAGQRSPSATLTDAQAAEIKYRLSAGEKSCLLAKEYEVSKYAISRIKRGIAYKHCGVEKSASRLAHNQETAGAEPVAATKHKIMPCPCGGT